MRRDGRENGEMGLWVGEEFHMGMVRGVVGGVLLSRYVKSEGRGGERVRVFHCRNFPPPG